MKGQAANLEKKAFGWRRLIAGGGDPALKPIYLRSAALLSLALAFGLRLYRLGYQSIWWDEGYSIGISSKSLSDIASSTAIDIHPPVYYWLLHFWLRLAGKSEFSARFLSLVFGVLIVALAYRLGLRLLGRNGAFLAAFLVAISPFFITYSQEARMYTLETLLGLASVYFLTELLLRQSYPQEKQRIPSGILWGAYVLVTLLALYTDYFPAAIMVFENLFVGAWAIHGLVRNSVEWSYAGGVRAQEMAIPRRSLILRFALWWVFAQLVVVLLYLPWLNIAFRQVRGWGFGVVTAPGFKIMLSQLWSAFNISIPVRLSTFPPSVFIPYLWLAAAILVIGLFLVILRKGKGVQERPYWKEAFLLCFLIIPLAMFLVVVRFRPFFHPRCMLFALPSYLLLLALALNAIWRWWRPLAVVSLGVICAASAVAIHGSFFDEAFFKDDARSAARFLAEEATEDDLVLWEINNYPLTYYYQGIAPAAEVRFSQDAIAEDMERLAGGRQRVFWVTWFTNAFDPWGMVPFLLEKNGRKAGETTFEWLKVQWYELSSEGSFSFGDVKAVDVNFENKIALTGVAFGGEEEGPILASGETGWVALRWRCLGRIEDNLKFYVHVYEKLRGMVGQDDRLLVNADGWQTSYWKEGDVTFSFAIPRIEPGTPPGDYSIEIGVYDAKTMDRLAIMSGSSPNTIGSFQVTPSHTPPAVESLEIKRPLSAKFDEIELLGYEQEISQVGQGDLLPFALFWHATQQPQSDMDVLVSLVDEGGMVGKEFCFPVSANYPTSKWRSSEAIRGHYSLLIPDNLPGGEWRLRIGLATEGKFVGEPVFLPPFEVIERQRSFVLPEAIQHQLKAEVGDIATLLGYSVDKDKVRAGDEFNLTLYWRAKTTADKRYTVFAHLIDEGNHIWGQRDSMPQDGRAPTTSWLEDEVIVDTYQIPVRLDCPAGEYSIEVGMYHLETSERLPVDGKDSLLLGSIKVLRL